MMEQRRMMGAVYQTKSLSLYEIQFLLDLQPSTNIVFPDVSFYQGNINWDRMKSKTNNVIIRSGQNTWVDENFHDNWTAAKQRGMHRDTYWFYDGRVSPQSQWATLRPLIEYDRPEGTVWVDWEHNFGGQHEGLGNVVAFMQLIEQAGFRVGMYTGYYFFVENSNSSSNANQYNYLKTRPLWEAWYTEDGSSNGILIPYPWTSQTIELHQFGTPPVGYDYGCESHELDMNRVLNNFEEYEGMPPSNGGGEMANTFYRALGNITIRTGPSTSYPQVTTGERYVLTGDIVESNVPPQNGFVNILNIWRADVDMATANPAWCGSAYLQLTTYVPPTPPSTDIPPQEVTVKDKDGNLWKATTFTKV